MQQNRIFFSAANTLQTFPRRTGSFSFLSGRRKADAAAQQGKSFSYPFYILFKLQVFVHTFSRLFSAFNRKFTAFAPFGCLCAQPVCTNVLFYRMFVHMTFIAVSTARCFLQMHAGFHCAFAYGAAKNFSKKPSSCLYFFMLYFHHKTQKKGKIKARLRIFCFYVVLYRKIGRHSTHHFLCVYPAHPNTIKREMM